MQKPNYSVMILLLLLSITTIQSDSFYKAYNQPSALIHYMIQGEGNITKNSHFEIKGHASLVFREWGAITLYKERYKEISTGVAKSTKILKTLKLDDYATISEVNFEKKQIEKRVDPIIEKALKDGTNLSDEFTKKAKRVGHSTILGYPCQEWQYRGKKQCLYKGIVLKEELNLLDINIFKIATAIDFDKNVTDDHFTLPTFLENESKGFLLKENVGLTTQADMLTAQVIVDDSIVEEGELTEETEEQDNIVAQKLTTELFNKQKELLPELLREMQEARVCLENAENVEEANICLDKVVKIKENISGEIEKKCKIEFWMKEAKEQRLQDIEEKIWAMKRQMPCIRRSQNIDDLSECMTEESL